MQLNVLVRIFEHMSMYAILFLLLLVSSLRQLISLKKEKEFLTTYF